MFFTLFSVLLNDVASDQGANETLVVACIDFDSSEVANSPSGTPLAILTSPTCSPQLTCLALVGLHRGIFSRMEGAMGFCCF